MNFASEIPNLFPSTVAFIATVDDYYPLCPKVNTAKEIQMGATLYHAPFGDIGDKVDWFESNALALARAYEIATDPLTVYRAMGGVDYLLLEPVNPPREGADNLLLQAVFAIVPDVLDDDLAVVDYPLPPI